MNAKDRDLLKNRIVQMHCDLFIDVDSKSKLKYLEKFIENSKHYQDVNLETQKDCNFLDDLVNRLLKSKSIDARGFTLLTVFHYLLAAEGIVCNFLNYVCLLLIQNGHDLFSLTRKKYVKNDYKEIMKTELSTKIEFLNYHGFKSLTKEYDSSLRNYIAHHNYLIDEKGDLFINGNKVDLGSKINSLTEIIYFATEIFEEATKRMAEMREK